MQNYGGWTIDDYEEEIELSFDDNLSNEKLDKLVKKATLDDVMGSMSIPAVDPMIIFDDTFGKKLAIFRSQLESIRQSPDFLVITTKTGQKYDIKGSFMQTVDQITKM